MQVQKVHKEKIYESGVKPLCCPGAGEALYGWNLKYINYAKTNKEVTCLRCLKAIRNL